jgi:CO/xanthine dehydrogenase Mo-binding subunit
MLHAAVVRSLVPRARIAGIDIKQALAAEDVVGVFTAADVTDTTYGRAVRDVPILAKDTVRYTGERVAAVVARTRRAAESAALLVDVTYDDLPPVLTADEAIAPGAEAVHDAPWEYPGAAARPEHGRNVQSRGEHGSRAETEAALQGADYLIDRTYTTQSAHQGYLEPQACIAAVEDGKVRIWAGNKSPYRLRAQLAEALNLDPATIDVAAVPIGGDFGGKGSPMEIPLVVELARLTGKPVKLVLRSAEDLTATNPRHPGRIRVRAGCDSDGRLTAVSVSALLNGGAYAGFKPRKNADLHGIDDCTLAYHVPALYIESVIAYTNTVPRGHMRAPGSPQGVFAMESALDELAAVAGLTPAEIRRRNLVPLGTPSVTGKIWAETRGERTLDAALEKLEQMEKLERHHTLPAGPRQSGGGRASAGRAEVPAGWKHGTGLAVYARETPGLAATSLRLVPIGDDRIRAEVPVPDTGAGSHAVVRNLLALKLDLSPADVEVVQVGTSELPRDAGVGGSRVTVGVAAAVDQAVRAWRDRADDDEPVMVTSGPDNPGDPPPSLASYCAQIARVAVDPGTGQVKVLELLSAVDVGQIVHPAGHQMQIDGGAIMGFGFACLEDLAEHDGDVAAANLGEFKLPAMGDIPELRTVLVEGARGITSSNVKPVGELTNVAVAPAIANAVADAVGCRIRDLPVTAEKVYWALANAAAAGPGTREKAG